MLLTVSVAATAIECAFGLKHSEHECLSTARGDHDRRILNRYSLEE